MKRKVIKQGHNTLTITLPKKWCNLYSIKGGEELEILEKEGSLLIGPTIEPRTGSVDIDVTGLDRTSLMLYIRSFYRLGYDEICVSFRNNTTPHYRLEKEVNVLSIIHQEVNRLVGVEIIEEKEGHCVIKNLSADPMEDFDVILRKIFFQINSLLHDLLEGLKSGNVSLLETAEEKHDTITKFVSYCLRLLNKRGYPEQKKTLYLYYTINSLDLVADAIKYAARYALRAKSKFTRKSLSLVNFIFELFESYSRFFYDAKLERVSYLSKNRDAFSKDLEVSSKTMSKEDLILISKLESIVEIVREMIGVRMGLLQIKR